MRARTRYRESTGVPSPTQPEKSRVGVAPISVEETPDSSDPSEQDTSDDGDDPFEYQLVYKSDYGWMLRSDSECPECGEDGVFNGVISLSPQFVAYEKEDDGTMLFGQDDVVHTQVEFLRCGNTDCREILVDNRGERVEDDRR